MKITVMRTAAALPADMKAASDFLFQSLDGFTEADRKAWRRFWKRIQSLEAGELASAEFVIPRNSKFHRKLFALLNLGFEAWEPGRKHKTYKGVPVLKEFEQFREDVTILAGYYEQSWGINGRMKVKAKSISFANMEQDEFERLYDAVATVLLEHVLTKYGRAELDETVAKILGFL